MWNRNRRLPRGVYWSTAIGVLLLLVAVLHLLNLDGYVIWLVSAAAAVAFLVLRQALEHECAELLLEMSTKFQAREHLEEYGFLRSASARYKGVLTVFAIAAVAPVVLYVASKIFNGLAGPVQGAVTGWIALGALFLGVQQWRAARNETSLDKFYDKLEVTNRRLDDCPSARDFAGPWLKLGEGNELTESDDCDSYERTMHVYRELDNLYSFMLLVA